MNRHADQQHTVPCTRCGATPTRLYAQGRLCADHSPSALAGQAEPAGGYCAPARHYCSPDARCGAWAAQQPLWRVLATGGRDRDDKPLVWGVFNGIRKEHPRLVVVHGAAYPKAIRGLRPDRSADWLIHLWCVANKIYEETHPADWKTCSTPDCAPEHRKQHRSGGTYCPDAGTWRNDEMVQLHADECVAFPGRGPGTRDCMRRAGAAGIPVRPIPWTRADQNPLFEQEAAS
ncbi:SLOG family protein [Nonomuraea zeae]|uniref:DUF2493 domain-containing protein n=1 Tax=Nonomuraea zeae TaxID=1642303 RepID=A0A5S4H3N4_9ACTN|nr:SLOG family protein [Nonomuraea zeae]TMR39619.1 DUF2493 domain-containing protein [Nonomuraea zeae]